jgi:hypothetical protein
VGEVFALSWSEKVLAFPGTDGTEQLFTEVTVASLVTLALSKDPVAEEMCPVGAWAETSLASPTVSGLEPLVGRYGFSGTGLHGTSRHWVFG